MDTTQENSSLFNKLSKLGMSDDLERWSLKQPLYSDLGINQDNMSELIELATNVELFQSESDSETWIPLHAWRILGELKAKNAVNTLIDMFDTCHDSDFAYEELPEIVSYLAGEDCLDRLSIHILDKSKDEWSRAMSLRAIANIAGRHDVISNQCIDILANCLNESDEGWCDFNGFLVSELTNLKATSKIEIIRKAFNDDIVNLSIMGDIEDAEIKLGLREAIDTEHDKLTIPNFANFFNSNKSSATHVTKTGRNAQCPCGSGKKYKKCCLD